MALPQTVRVKLSSEAAGTISLTPVVVQEMPVRQLVELILARSGKDEARLLEVLARGTLVSGGSRFRWAGWEPVPEELRELLATFPDPDPARPFAAERCVRALLRGPRLTVEVPRDATRGRGLFRRTTFWDVLMEASGAATPVYAGYSYRECADYFVCELPAAACERLRSAAGTIRYTSLRDRVRAVAFTHVELYVSRGA